jgi:hypothetical protein
VRTAQQGETCQNDVIEGLGMNVHIPLPGTTLLLAVGLAPTQRSAAQARQPGRAAQCCRLICPQAQCAAARLIR